MDIITLKNPEEVGKRTASIIQEEIKNKPNLVLGLASGSTMLPFFKHIASKKLNFSKIKTFIVDEYLGLNKQDKKSIRSFMEKNLFRRINLKKNNIDFLDGRANPKKECKRYESKIKTHKIDVQLLGIGRNGHIGFNEPGSSFKSRTRKVKLVPMTRKDNSRFFNSINEVPKNALTMGIATILEAKKIILLATGKHKANIIAKVILEKQTTKVPASALQKHKDVTIILDKEAASQLEKS